MINLQNLKIPLLTSEWMKIRNLIIDFIKKNGWEYSNYYVWVTWNIEERTQFHWINNNDIFWYLETSEKIAREVEKYFVNYLQTKWDTWWWNNIKFIYVYKTNYHTTY